MTWGLSTRKSGAATGELGGAESRFGKRVGVSVSVGAWPLDVGSWSSGRSQSRR